MKIRLIKTYSRQPWFIKRLQGKPVVMVCDFNKLAGLDISELNLFFRPEYFKGGEDFNGLGQGPLREEFERVNNVHYEEETVMYMYVSGVAIALKILEEKYNVNVTHVRRLMSDQHYYIR